jgi:bifunctional DNA-binding transcriptional regulator/antitoxin component of YhaV-PrlF toxin-antitoxin module
MGPAREGEIGLYNSVKLMPKISSKNQVTLPVDALAAAALQAGDAVLIEAAGEDTIVIRRAPRDIDAAIGIFDGLYEPGYLDRLRAGERE